MASSHWRHRTIHLCGGDLTSGPRDDCLNPLHDYPLPAGYADASEAAERRLRHRWDNVRCPDCRLYGWRPGDPTGDPCDERVPAQQPERMMTVNETSQPEGGYEDQAAAFIAGVERHAKLGLSELPDNPAAAAAMRAEGFEVLAEVRGVVGPMAIVSVLSEDEDQRHAVKAWDLAGALGSTPENLVGRQFIATYRETPETGPVLSGFRPVPAA